MRCRNHRLGERLQHNAEQRKLVSKFAIYSAEGFTREIIPSVKRQYGVSADEIVLVDDDPQKIGTAVQGSRVISFEQLREDIGTDCRINVAIADPRVREKLVGRCAEAGFSFFSIADPTHVRFENVDIGDGSVFCALTMATGDAVIGRHFHANIYSYVAHDCRIGDFVTFAPRVSCNGRVEIEDYAYIGTGALLRQGTQEKPLRIGKGAVVGMGAVVVKDVEPGDVVAGNPAKVLKSAKGG